MPGRATEAPWCTVKTFIAAVGSRSTERQQAPLRCYLPKHQEKAGGGERLLRRWTLTFGVTHGSGRCYQKQMINTIGEANE